jgi:hypothetical protein
MLRSLPSGDRRVLCPYEIPDHTPLRDLNDPNEMLRQSLNPSRIMTRDRAVTQKWASTIFEQQVFAGIEWWSYCDARWGAFGLWDRRVITPCDVEELSLAHPAVVEAAESMGVRIKTR